jgi:hypothetical protein
VHPLRQGIRDLKEWYVYRLDHMSVEGWRSFGIRHNPIVDNRDITAMSRALSILAQCVTDVDWFNDHHEYWLVECPMAPPIVCVRPGSNPFDSGYLVSPIHLSHLKSTRNWVVSHS